MGSTLQEKTLAQAIHARRSIRTIGRTPEIARETVEEVIQLALKAPSAFNMQSDRMVVVMGESHEKLWDMVKD
jgi:hypothetical protein